MYKVIIVEDDPMVAAINARYLQSNGQLQLAGTFSNGQDALACVREQPIDLAIVDYYMPLLNGRDFIRQCRQEHIVLDVIMITANNAAQEVTEIMRLGVVDYLVKPFTAERFAQALRRYLDQKNALQPGRQLTQAEIDQLLSAGNVAPAATPALLEKGLQQKTLDLILAYLDQNQGVFFSSEEIAREVGLSRITVRRYMNYLLENKVILSQIDYATGGRPSIRYRKR